MNLVVIGSGGREHAICYKLKQSPKIKKLICIPGNAGTKNIAENIKEGDYVICAVSGKHISLNQLTYWNVELQEAYFSPKEAQQRYEELNKK